MNKIYCILLVCNLHYLHIHCDVRGTCTNFLQGAAINKNSFIQYKLFTKVKM